MRGRSVLRAMRKPRCDELEVAFEVAVLVLDRDDPVVADRVERADETIPPNLAEPWEARHLPADAQRHHALLVQPVAVDLHVLGVDVEDARRELADRARVVDELPDEVRGVEVQTEVVVGDDLEQLAPQRRRVREVASARPLVGREDHRAVLDRDLHAVLARVAHEGRPDPLEVLEVVRRPSAADRGRRTCRRSPPRAAAPPRSRDAGDRWRPALRPRRGRGCSGSRRATRSPGRSERGACARALGLKSWTSMCETPA